VRGAALAKKAKTRRRCKGKLGSRYVAKIKEHGRLHNREKSSGGWRGHEQGGPGRMVDNEKKVGEEAVVAGAGRFQGDRATKDVEDAECMDIGRSSAVRRSRIGSR